MGDTRTDSGQYYPGGRVTARREVAPPQVVVRWSDVQGKPQIAPLPERYRESDMKEKINEIGSKLATTVAVALVGYVAFAGLVVQTARKDAIWNDTLVVTNVELKGGGGLDTNAVERIANRAAETNAVVLSRESAVALAATNHANSVGQTVAIAATNYTDGAAAGKADEFTPWVFSGSDIPQNPGVRFESREVGDANIQVFAVLTSDGEDIGVDTDIGQEDMVDIDSVMSVDFFNGDPEVNCTATRKRVLRTGDAPTQSDLSTVAQAATNHANSVGQTVAVAATNHANAVGVNVGTAATNYTDTVASELGGLVNSTMGKVYENAVAATNYTDAATGEVARTANAYTDDALVALTNSQEFAAFVRAVAGALISPSNALFVAAVTNSFSNGETMEFGR